MEIVIALVEYLTSEDAGNPLGGRFAWPVDVLVNGQAGKKIEQNGRANGTAHSNGVAKANDAAKAYGNWKKST